MLLVRSWQLLCNKRIHHMPDVRAWDVWLIVWGNIMHTMPERDLLTVQQTDHVPELHCRDLFVVRKQRVHTLRRRNVRANQWIYPVQRPQQQGRPCAWLPPLPRQ